ncbi:MAG: PfkB family carbohydrate kinase [Dermatophilaceae bacterium]
MAMSVTDAVPRGATPSLLAVPPSTLATPEALIVYPGVLPPRFVVTVLGDVRIDVVSAVRSRRFAQLTHDHDEPTGVATVVGGTAMGFARAAAPHFAEVRVIAAIGEDHWSDTIRTAAREAGVVACFDQHPGLSNGVVVIVRDAGSPGNPGGVRLLLAQEPSPYGHLDVEFVRRQQDVIASSDALVIDGYALLHDRSAAAVDLATQIADAAGVPVSFDLVPHKIDERVAASRIAPFLRFASMRIVEAPTVARLLRRGVPNEPSRRYATELAERLPRSPRGTGQTSFVRFGYAMMEETVAVTSGGPTVYYRTGYARQRDGSGYGYAVAAAELKWWLTQAAQTGPQHWC